MLSAGRTGCSERCQTHALQGDASRRGGLGLEARTRQNLRHCRTQARVRHTQRNILIAEVTPAGQVTDVQNILPGFRPCLLDANESVVSGVGLCTKAHNTKMTIEDRAHHNTTAPQSPNSC